MITERSEARQFLEIFFFKCFDFYRKNEDFAPILSNSVSTLSLMRIFSSIGFIVFEAKFHQRVGFFASFRKFLKFGILQTSFCCVQIGLHHDQQSADDSLSDIELNQQKVGEFRPTILPTLNYDKCIVKDIYHLKTWIVYATWKNVSTALDSNK